MSSVLVRVNSSTLQKSLKLTRFASNFTNKNYRNVLSSARSKYLCLIGGGLIGFSYTKYIHNSSAVVHAFSPKKLKVGQPQIIFIIDTP